MIMDLSELAIDIHEIAREKGFWNEEPDVTFVLSKIALIHSEASETLEAVRKQQGSDAISEELVDILIRVFDLYEGMRHAYDLPDLDKVMIAKMEKNRGRPYRHGVLA